MYFRPLAAALAIALSLSAQAQDAFNSYYGPSAPILYSLLPPPQGPDQVAWRFAATSGGPVTALSIGAYRTGPATQPSTLSIFAVNGTQVGNLLGSIPINLPLGQNAPILTVATPASGITLIAGQEYFFCLAIPASTDAWWRIYGPPLTPGPQATRIGSGPWSYAAHPQIYYPGFSVTVPAPGSVILLAPALGFAVRRRRGHST